MGVHKYAGILRNSELADRRMEICLRWVRDTYSCTNTTVILLDSYIGKWLCLNCDGYSTAMAAPGIDLGSFDLCSGIFSHEWWGNILRMNALLAIESYRS